MKEHVHQLTRLLVLRLLHGAEFRSYKNHGETMNRFLYSSAGTMKHTTKLST